jgi:hypothetical protein
VTLQYFLGHTPLLCTRDGPLDPLSDVTNSQIACVYIYIYIYIGLCA